MIDAINFENVTSEAKDTFAHFGYVGCLLQNFEKGLAVLLQGEIALENNGKIPYDKYQEEITKLYKCNLGGLLKKLRKRTIISTEIEELLVNTLNGRNYLIHDYFYHNESKAMVTDGRLSIIHELIEDQTMFSEAIKWVDQRCKESLLKIGVTQANFAEVLEKTVEQSSPNLETVSR